MKRNPIPPLVLAAASASLALTACGGAGGTVHNQRSFAFRGTSLVIDDQASDLQVVPGRGPGVGAQRWLGGTPARPGHSAWTLRGGVLRLSVDCSGLVFRCDARFRVAVPPGVGVVVNSGSGTDTITGLRGPLTVNGGSGTVRLSGVSGPVQVTTGSGNVTATAITSTAVRVTANEGAADLSFSAAPRSVAVTCSSGNATVRVPTAGHRYRVLVGSGTGAAVSKVPSDPRSSSVVRVSSRQGDAAVLPGGAAR